MNQMTTTNAGSATAITNGGGKGLMGDMLRNPQLFEHVCRMAKIYANSPLFPEHLRKGGIDIAIANAVLVMNIASRLNEDELTVAQNIYFVGGKPGWSASYMISKANQHGVFRNPIDWEITGKGETLSVTAYGNLKSTNKRVEVTMSMETAKKEGWTKNAKYQSIPEVMLRYRSATALIRLYCPEVMIGMPSDVEIETEGQTMRDVTPQSDPIATITGADDAKPTTEAKPASTTRTEDYDPETGEVTEPAPKKVDRQKPAPAPKKEDPAPEDEVTEPVAPKVDQQTEVQGISSGSDERHDPAESSEPSAKVINLRNSILNDIEASGAPDAVESFYAEELAKMEVEAPGVHAALKAAFEAARA